MAIRDLDIERRARELAAQDWTVEVRRTEGGGWFAKVVELPGCQTEADTWEELGDMIRDAIEGWIAVALEHGDSIPLPRNDARYSGKIFVRTSPRLHRLVAEAAERNRISMSQWVAEVLAREVGAR